MTDNLPTTFAAGHLPTGTEWQNVLDSIRSMRVYVRKTLDESLTSSTVLQNDDQLLVSVEANSTYRFDSNFAYSSVTGADIQFGWTAPSGSTMLWTGHSLDPSGSYFGDIKMQAFNIGDVADCAGGGAVPCVFKGSGSLFTGANAGTFRLRWAQIVSNASATWVYANSDLLLTKVA